MGVYNTELFNNLGLCCFYAQQYDMTLTCFERALSLATDENMADVWYNIGHVALGIGDLTLAYQSFRLALASNNDHAEAYNNLGVLEMRKGRIEMVSMSTINSSTVKQVFFASISFSRYFAPIVDCENNVPQK